MILFILFTLIGAFILIWDDFDRDPISVLKDIFIACLGVSPFTVLFTLFLSSSIPVGEPEYKTVVSEQQIVSLKANQESEMKGAFFLGTGNIQQDNKIYYYYYTVDKGGNYLLEKSETSDTYLKQQDSTKKKVIERKYVRYSERSKWLFNVDKDWNLKDTKTILYIPKNTIIEEYNVSF